MYLQTLCMRPYRHIWVTADGSVSAYDLVCGSCLIGGPLFFLYARHTSIKVFRMAFKVPKEMHVYLIRDDGHLKLATNTLYQFTLPRC